MISKFTFALASVVALAALTGCAPAGYTYNGFSLVPIPGYQEALRGHEWGSYVEGKLDCNNQHLMSQSDCRFGMATKAYPNEAQIKDMHSYGINNINQYEAAAAEANDHNGFSTVGASPVDTWRVVESYLRTKERAKKNGLTVEQIVANDAQEKLRKRAEFNKEYPYLAELTCTMGSGQAILMVCFSPLYSQDGGTVLELTNGNQYHMYQFMDIQKAGIDLDGRFVIPLRRSFILKAQNNSNNFLLNLVVKDSSNGNVLYRKSAAQFGTVYVNNK